MTTTLYKDNTGNSYSAHPATTYLTFAYWIYCVPQYKPTGVLILGYGQGTIAGLIHTIYGDVSIIGVDTEECENRYNDTLIKCDARDFIKLSLNYNSSRKPQHKLAEGETEYDTVIVDLFDRETSTMCDFVTSAEFAESLGKLSNYIIVNTLKNADMSEYDKRFRKIGMNSPSGSAEKIYYYEVNKIPNLHPYK